MVYDWISVTYQALLSTWQGIISFLPSLIVAILIFIIGWFVAVGIEKLIVKLLIGFRFNRLFEESAWKNALEKAEVYVNPAEFVGAIFRWVLIIVFLMIAVEILGLTTFADFLASVVSWLPNLVVAVAIFVVAAVLADILGKATVASVERVQTGYAKLAGKIVRWSIWIFAISMILEQLQVGEILVNTLFTGIVAGLALAFGIAFGLGGKDMASDFLRYIKDHMRHSS